MGEAAPERGSDGLAARVGFVRAAMASRRVRIVAALIGIGLVGLAVVVAARSPDGLEAAWSHMTGAPWWLVALGFALPVVNWLTTTGVFAALYGRRGAVGWWEMAWLMASSRLLNYLPMRPGLVGRALYLRAARGIRVVDSAAVTVEGVLISMACLGLACVMALAWVSSAWLGVCVCCAVASGLVVTALVPVAGAMWRARAVAGLWKLADIAVWSGRAMVFFALVGRPLGPAEAVAVTVVAHGATLIPLVGNGLGVREWAVVAMAGLLPSGTGVGLDALALSAELTHRAVDMVVTVALGVCAAGILGARLRAVREPRSVSARTETMGPGAGWPDEDPVCGLDRRRADTGMGVASDTGDGDARDGP